MAMLFSLKTVAALWTLLAVWLTVGGSLLPPCRHIQAAVRWASTNVTYFFSGGEVIRHNDDFQVEQEVMFATDFVDNFPTDIDAAVNWFGRRKSLYFKRCHVYKFHEVQRRLRRRHLSRVGLPCHVDAALNIDGRRILVFKDCQYWVITRNNRRAVLAGFTNDLSLPCNIDAALTWKNGTSYVIKNDVIWTLSQSMVVANAGSLEGWNLCSWRICGSNVTNMSGPALLGPHFPCNGDLRFCALRFDQVTLAGSHNAGSGFDGGFGFFSCWVRNQYLTVLEQLRFGIRFLDVDTSWQHCGMLGSFHNFLCGGPVCKMLKQIRRFLEENRHEVVAINFNHEMQDVDSVMPTLVRQVTSQLGRYLNSQYRDTGSWPVLGDAIRSDKRLFVFVGKRLTDTFLYRIYSQHHWIHGSHLLQSTWRGDVSVDDHCQEVVESSRLQCQLRRDSALLEVSILGYSTNCVTTIADLCLPLVHQIASDCQTSRHGKDKAPNVLLVDFPERTPHPDLSVVSAAFLQNVRNVAMLGGACEPSIQSAVSWRLVDDEQHVLFFSGPRPVLYNWSVHAQHNARISPQNNLPASADAAFRRTGVGDEVCLVRGCDVHCYTTGDVAGTESTVNFSLDSWGLPCPLQAAFTRHNVTHFFTGCQYWRRPMTGQLLGPQEITDLGLPCDISAALQAPDGATYYFKGDQYWKENGENLSQPKTILEWSADFVQCT